MPILPNYAEDFLKGGAILDLFKSLHLKMLIQG